MTERPDVKYKGFVPAGNYRTWTSGKYSVEALFVRSENDRVTLRNMYGKEIVVPLDRLDDKDRRWIRREANKPPPEEEEIPVPGMTKRPDAGPQGDPILPRMTERPDVTRRANVVNLYTIYNKQTSDYPGVMVMRRWEVSGPMTAPKMEPKEVVGTGNDIREMRKLLPEGCNNLGRFAPEDPNIVETWMKQ